MAGTLARAGLAEAWPPEPGHWPWATFLVNVAGSALLGHVLARGWNRALWGVGVCGALTTFSTFQLERLQMLDEGRVALAVLHAAASIGCGLLAFRAGERAA